MPPKHTENFTFADEKEFASQFTDGKKIKSHFETQLLSLTQLLHFTFNISIKNLFAKQC